MLLASCAVSHQNQTDTEEITKKYAQLPQFHETWTETSLDTTDTDTTDTAEFPTSPQDTQNNVEIPEQTHTAETQPQDETLLEEETPMVEETQGEVDVPHETEAVTDTPADPKPDPKPDGQTSTIVTEDAFYHALDEKNFNHVTMEYIIHNRKETDTYLYQYMGDVMSCTHNGQTQTMQNEGEMSSAYISQSIGVARGHFQDLTYDPEHKWYMGIYQNMGLTYAFENGVLKKFAYYKLESDGSFSTNEYFEFYFSHKDSTDA